MTSMARLAVRDVHDTAGVGHLQLRYLVDPVKLPGACREQSALVI